MVHRASPWVSYWQWKVFSPLICVHALREINQGATGASFSIAFCEPIFAISSKGSTTLHNHRHLISIGRANKYVFSSTGGFRVEQNPEQSNPTRNFDNLPCPCETHVDPAHVCQKPYTGKAAPLRNPSADAREYHHVRLLPLNSHSQPKIRFEIRILKLSSVSDCTNRRITP